MSCLYLFSASMAALPMMLGCLCAGYPMDRFGRRLSIMVSCLIFATGWAVIGFATNVISKFLNWLFHWFSIKNEDSIVKTDSLCRASISRRLHWKFGATDVTGTDSYGLFSSVLNFLKLSMHRETKFTIILVFHSEVWIWFCKQLIPVEKAITIKLCVDTARV